MDSPLLQLNAEALSEMSNSWRARLINSLPGYKSGMLVGTYESGSANLAIISSHFHLGSNPALLGMILRPDTGKGERHTLHNVLKTECWTLNGFRLDSAAQAHQTSAPYPKNVSEFSACGFDAEWRMGTDAPYVKSSPLQVGCRLREHQALNINGTHLLIGEVTALYCAADAQRDDGSLDLGKLELATVSGLDTYSEPGKSRRFDLARVDTPLREQ